MTAKLFAKGLQSHRTGDWAGAEQTYRRILRKTPKHLDANYMLGTLYAEQGQLAAALPHLQYAAELDPRSPYIRNNLGNVHLLLGKLDEAETCFRQALARNPGLAEAHNNLGNIYKRRGDIEAAVDSYQAAILAKPDFIDAAVNLSGMLLDAGQPEAAQPLLTEVLKMAPGNALAHETLATAQMKLGQNDEAVQHLRRSLELGGHPHSEAALKLARLGEGEIPESYPANALRRTYEQKAATWDRDVARSEDRFFGPAPIQTTVEKLLPGKTSLTILDIGCGTGACGPFLRPLASKLDGVDLSPHMLEQAVTKNLYDHLECTDMLALLRQSTDSYDLISASGVMILLGDLEAPLKAVAHALKAEGLFVFTVYNNDAEAVSVRENLHFAHNRKHIEEKSAIAGLKVISIDSVVHEIANGIAQPGLIVALQKQPQGC
jgi:predicted TPR repeat methyltransferase